LNETGYEYFDFHHHVKNQRFENSNALIAKLFPALDSLNFTIEDLATGTIESSQQGFSSDFERGNNSINNRCFKNKLFGLS